MVYSDGFYLADADDIQNGIYEKLKNSILLEEDFDKKIDSYIKRSKIMSKGYGLRDDGLYKVNGCDVEDGVLSIPPYALCVESSIFMDAAKLCVHKITGGKNVIALLGNCDSKGALTVSEIEPEGKSFMLMLVMALSSVYTEFIKGARSKGLLTTVTIKDELIDSATAYELIKYMLKSKNQRLILDVNKDLLGRRYNERLYDTVHGVMFKSGDKPVYAKRQEPVFVGRCSRVAGAVKAAADMFNEHGIKAKRVSGSVIGSNGMFIGYCCSERMAEAGHDKLWGVLAERVGMEQYALAEKTQRYITLKWAEEAAKSLSVYYQSGRREFYTQGCVQLSLQAKDKDYDRYYDINIDMMVSTCGNDIFVSPAGSSRHEKRRGSKSTDKLTFLDKGRTLQELEMDNMCMMHYEIGYLAQKLVKESIKEEPESAG